MRAIVPTNLPDDVICPSTRRVISQNNLSDIFSPFCADADELLNEGNEGAMLARPTESVLVEPENSSRGGTYDQQHKHPLQDAETSECH